MVGWGRMGRLGWCLGRPRMWDLGWGGKAIQSRAGEGRGEEARHGALWWAHQAPLAPPAYCIDGETGQRHWGARPQSWDLQDPEGPLWGLFMPPNLGGSFWGCREGSWGQMGCQGPWECRLWLCPAHWAMCEGWR